MKQKTITRAEWQGIRARSYAEKRFDWGIAGLIDMLDAEEFFVRSGGSRLRITAPGYQWLELAPENKNVWATVMFDSSGKLFQCYFDISAENVLLDGGKSFFHDLYLDVVARVDSETLFLYDEDELEYAYKSGEIDHRLRASAYRARGELLRFLDRDRECFFDFCRRTRVELLPCLKPLGY